MIGPDVVIQTLGYTCSERDLATSLNPDDVMTFVINTASVTEYLDIVDAPMEENILQTVHVYI